MNDQQEVVLPKNRYISVAVIVACVSITVWWALVCIFNPTPIADEFHYHIPTILRFCEGDWRIPGYLPMWPTYHAMVSIIAKNLGQNVLVLRGASMGMAIIAVWFYWLALSDRKHKERNYALFSFVWMPFFFPFTALVYTDVASVMLVTIVLFTHMRQHHIISALVMIVACAVRQSNAFWLVLMLFWAMSMPGDFVGSYKRIRNAGPYVLSGIIVGGFFLWHGSMTPHTEVVAQIGINPAQLYSVLITMAFLYAPIWLARIPETYRLICSKARTHPAWWTGVGFVTLSSLVVAFIGYQNPHEWNQETTFLRNYFLIGMADNVYIRFMFLITMLLAVPTLILWGWGQPNKRMLFSTLLISLFYIMSHALVEPRYFIQPILLLGFCSRMTVSESRNQTLWYVVLSVAICGFIGMNGHPGGGML